MPDQVSRVPVASLVRLVFTKPEVNAAEVTLHTCEQPRCKYGTDATETLDTHRTSGTPSLRKHTGTVRGTTGTLKIQSTNA